MFQPVKIYWDGEEHTIPASRVLRAIAIAEQHISLLDIARLREHPMPAAIAAAYAGVLRFIGIDVDDETVYEAICDHSAGDAEKIMAATTSLILMMLPPQITRGNLQPDAARVIIKGRRKGS
jgi:hypothetical protein